MIRFLLKCCCNCLIHASSLYLIIAAKHGDFSQQIDVKEFTENFLKRILGVKMSTNNMTLYSETGRFPLFLGRYIRII